MSMKVMEIAYPEDLPKAMGETAEEFEREVKLLVAAKLYEMGRISSGRAAEIADMGRIEFLESLSRYRISVFNYSLEDLDREIETSRGRVRGTL